MTLGYLITLDLTESWEARSLTVHRKECLNYLHAETKSKCSEISKAHGIRYSCLMELSYFNPICFAVIDPMHNLFLGTAKHVMGTWTDKGILGKREFRIIEEKSKHLVMLEECHLKFCLASPASQLISGIIGPQYFHLLH